MVNYNAYLRANKRMIICESGISLDRALDFLSETKHGIITDTNGKELTKEELENAKSIRSLPGIGEADLVASGTTVHEDSYRELFEFARDNTKPGSKRDS